jgi:putative transposase
MTENGDPLENAVAERIKGIIKEEYLFNYDIKTLTQAPGMLKRAVELYHTERPHLSICNLTPQFVHSSNKSLNIERLWKNYYKKNAILVKPFQD